MKKYRVGTDIEIHWPITTNGQELSLEGRDLKLVLTTPLRQKVFVSFVVDDNVIVIIFPGTEQKIIGSYNLTLWENFGKQHQTVVDKCEAFELVPWSCMAGGNDRNLVTRPVVQLDASDMVVGLPGYSAYEIAVNNGFKGTEEDWLASLIGPKGDAFTYSDFTPEQIKELQKPATETITQLQTTDNAVKQNEQIRQTAETQRQQNETQRGSAFSELYQNLNKAISNADAASQKATEAAANIPVTIKLLKKTTDINI